MLRQRIENFYQQLKQWTALMASAEQLGTAANDVEFI